MMTTIAKVLFKFIVMIIHDFVEQYENLDIENINNAVIFLKFARQFKKKNYILIAQSILNKILARLFFW